MSAESSRSPSADSAFSHAIDLEFIEQYRELDEPGKPSVLFELLRLTAEMTPPRLRTLAAAAISADLKAIGFEAHALKNVAGNVGAHAMSKLCEELEHRARGGTDLDAAAATALSDRIATEWERVLAAVEAVRSTENR